MGCCFCCLIAPEPTLLEARHEARGPLPARYLRIAFSPRGPARSNHFSGKREHHHNNLKQEEHLFLAVSLALVCRWLGNHSLTLTHTHSLSLSLCCCLSKQTFVETNTSSTESAVSSMSMSRHGERAAALISGLGIKPPRRKQSMFVILGCVFGGNGIFSRDQTLPSCLSHLSPPPFFLQSLRTRTRHMGPRCSIRSSQRVLPQNERNLGPNCHSSRRRRRERKEMAMQLLHMRSTALTLHFSTSQKTRCAPHVCLAPPPAPLYCGCRDCQ